MPAQKPQDIHDLFLDAFNRGDVEALVALYEPEALLVTASGPSVLDDATAGRQTGGVGSGRGHREVPAGRRDSDDED